MTVNVIENVRGQDTLVVVRENVSQERDAGGPGGTVISLLTQTRRKLPTPCSLPIFIMVEEENTSALQFQ